MVLTVGTFNLNNLFDRWNFTGAVELLAAGTSSVPATYTFDNEDRRRLQLDGHGKLLVAKPPADTARIAERLLAADVDVWVVQEIENVDVLREFNREHLGGAYEHVMVIDGNDSVRFIDIGILSRRPLGGVTSYQRVFHPDVPDRPIFSRDLVEAEIPGRSRAPDPHRLRYAPEVQVRRLHRRRPGRCRRGRAVAPAAAGGDDHPDHRRPYFESAALPVVRGHERHAGLVGAGRL
jgi:endonuclease/exonuclease/phosphatase family protein